MDKPTEQAKAREPQPGDGTACERVIDALENTTHWSRARILRAAAAFYGVNLEID